MLSWPQQGAWFNELTTNYNLTGVIRNEKAGLSVGGSLSNQENIWGRDMKYAPCQALINVCRFASVGIRSASFLFLINDLTSALKSPNILFLPWWSEGYAEINHRGHLRCSTVCLAATYRGFFRPDVGKWGSLQKRYFGRWSSHNPLVTGS